MLNICGLIITLPTFMAKKSKHLLYTKQVKCRPTIDHHFKYSLQYILSSE